ncbi:MAG: hypothetical protein K6T57_07010 [Thermaceae bacterium]|nr:hypothetical protein [Thermaceae bacterium]
MGSTVARAGAVNRFPVWQNLLLLRPRFLYLRAEIKEIPLPVLLVFPLSLLELAPPVASWILRRQGRPQTEPLRSLLQGLRGQGWALRKLPPLALLEVEVRGQIRLKMGLW